MKNKINVLKLSLAVLMAFFVLGLPLQSPLRAALITPNTLDQVSQATILATYGQLPLSFEVNRGQIEGQVKFLARGSGYSLFLTPTEAVLALRKPAGPERQHLPDLEARLAETEETRSIEQAVLRMQLVGANAAPQMVGLEKLPDQVNYFLGNDPARWRTNVPSYAKVRYQAVYPGIDLVYYGNQGQLEYDFVVAPGADPSLIRLGFAGAEKVEVDGEGELVVELAGEQVRMRKPVIYQERDGIRWEISGGYTLLPEGEGRGEGLPQVGFRVGAYDIGRPLVIDPVLVYSTYLGGSGSDSVIVRGLTMDTSDNAYIAGVTHSPDFPTANAVQATFGGSGDLFVTKLDATGTLVYSTYLGGSSTDSGTGIEEVDLIAVDMAGNAYLAGITLSPNFPTMNAVQATFGGSDDHFVTKLDATGVLVYSTYLGGSGSDGTVQGFAVDASGNAYIVGVTVSTNFPTMNAVQGSFSGIRDVAVTKLNATGGFVYSTYLGGNTFESLPFAAGLAVDASGNAYVLGSTRSANFPTENAVQSTFGGIEDAFVTKFNPTGGFVYSTFLGGSSLEFVGNLAMDMNGNAYVMGLTASANFPTTTQATFGGGTDVFVTKLNDLGGFVYSTYFGGNSTDRNSDLAVDTNGNAYVVGDTTSANFPTLNAVQSSFGGGSHDAFVTKLDAAGVLVYSTYLGGSGSEFFPNLAVDTSGNAYVVGDTPSADFPIMNAVQPSFGGGSHDAFVTKLDATGGFVYSTYLGGSASESIDEFAVDTSGNTYAVGGTSSPDFPTENAVQTTFGGSGDAFVTKLNATGGFVYSTYLGGSGGEGTSDLAVDTNGNTYVLGGTGSFNFPTANAMQATYGGSSDAFMVKITDDGPPAANAGGPYSGDEGGNIQLDASGSADPDQDNTTLLYEWDLNYDGVNFDVDTTGIQPVVSFPDNFPVRPIAVRVTDADELTDLATTFLVVTNVAPTATFANASGDVLQGESATLAFSNQFDPSPVDTTTGFLYSYDCTGDSTFEASDVSATSFDCPYPTSGNFTARGLIKDKDGGSTPYTVGVTVLTPQQAIESLIDDVQSLVDTGVLNQGQGNALMSKLENAIERLNQGNTNTAINMLEAFINQVNAMISSGLLLPEDGQPLLDAANEIIAILSS